MSSADNSLDPDMIGHKVGLDLKPNSDSVSERFFLKMIFFEDKTPTKKIAVEI